MVKFRTYLNTLRHRYSAHDLLILALVASAFLSYQATIVMGAATVLYLIYSGDIGHIFRSVPGAAYILAFCGLAIVLSMAYGEDQAIYVSFGILLAIILVLFLRYAITQRIFEQAIDLSCALSVLCCLVAILQWLSMPGGRFPSTFYNANYYASIIEIVSLFALYRLITNKGGWKKSLFYGLVLFANLVGLEICECRTAYAVIALAAPVLLALVKRKYLYAYFGIMLFALCVLAVKPDLFPRFFQLSRDFDTRMSIWKSSFLGFLEHPILGSGCLSYARSYSLYGGYPGNHAHNMVLEMLLNYGVVGMGLACAYLFGNVRSILRLYTQRVDCGRAGLSLAIVAAVLIHGLVDATLFWPQTAILAAIVLSSCGIYERSARPARALQPYPASRRSRRAYPAHSSVSFKR